MESAASGIMAGINAVRKAAGRDALILPRETMTGALARYISDETVTNFQPMGANMGILPELEANIRDKQERYMKIAERGLAALEEYMEENQK